MLLGRAGWGVLLRYCHLQSGAESVVTAAGEVRGVSTAFMDPREKCNIDYCDAIRMDE